jgi:hypothetical protein
MSLRFLTAAGALGVVVVFVSPGSVPAAAQTPSTLAKRWMTALLSHTPWGDPDLQGILQIPGYVVILYEMLYEPRIIPPDGRPHVGQDIKPWRGDSRGRWEGNTLVVDTTNFSDKVIIRGINSDPTEALHVTERFTRVNARTIDYQFTIDNPKTWTRPWTAAVPMTRTDELMYEYACHEGNYGMVGILAGARAEERTVEERAKKER